MSFRSLFPRAGVAASVLLVALASCGPKPDATEEIIRTFNGFKLALIGGQARKAVDFLDQDTLHLLQQAAMHPSAPPSPEAKLDELVHGTAEKLTPGGVGPGFTLDQPLQRVLDAGWTNLHDINSLAIGGILVKGDLARAELFWEGTPTTFKVLFAREDGRWKIDLRNAIPYAELALQADRAMHNETDEEQVQRLLRALPVP